MKIRWHLSININGLLRNYKGRKMNGLFEDENGRSMSDTQARIFIAECQSKGYKLIPNDQCEGFDPFENGCPGHKIDDKQ